MKKAISVLCLCVGLCLPGFCLHSDFFLYGFGEKFSYSVDELVVQQEPLTLKQITTTINNGGFLPIELGYSMAYKELGDRKKAIEAAEAKLAKEKSYRTYYNAAIVYANKADFQGYDNPALTKEEYAQKAIHYAAKAIEIGKKSKYTDAPYMNLLIGEMYFERAYYRHDKANAEAALKNFQKAATLKPIIGPYNSMRELAQILGKADLVQKYTNLNAEYSKIRQTKAEQAYREKEAVQKEIKKKNRKQSTNLLKAGISSHWKF